MKTIDEILDLADSYAENPCQAICDALYKNEDEARDKILELELRLREATEKLDHDKETKGGRCIAIALSAWVMGIITGINVGIDYF